MPSDWHRSAVVYAAVVHFPQADELAHTALRYTSHRSTGGAAHTSVGSVLGHAACVGSSSTKGTKASFSRMLRNPSGAHAGRRLVHVGEQWGHWAEVGFSLMAAVLYVNVRAGARVRGPSNAA